MYRKAVGLLLRQVTRSLRLPVLMICCVAGAASVVLSQEQSPPAPISSPSPFPAPFDPTTIEPDSAIVAIPNDGEFYFGKVRTAEADLPEKIKQALKDKPPEEQIVYIKAAASVRYGTVVSVIDAIRVVGIDQIGLVADKKKKKKKKRRDAKPGPDVRPNRPANNSSRSSDSTLSTAPAPVIIIDVKSKTRLKLNGKGMLVSQLRSRLQKLLAGRSDKTVFIKAPRTMSYGDVVNVIDLAKGVGAQPVGLQLDSLE